MEYDRAARKRLGREIRSARVKAGFTNRSDFADQLGRSARQVQALEQGESGVGPDTWMRAAEVLGWDVHRPVQILEGEQPESTPPELTTVSDEELAAEVLRRMKGGGGHEQVPTNVTELGSRERMQETQKKAAQSKPRTDP